MGNTLYGGLIEIGSDGQPITPDVILAFRSGTKQDVISNVQSFRFVNSLINASEITFDVYKYANSEKCGLWDDIRDFKLIYVPHFDSDTFNPWYELSVEVDENDTTIKHCHGVHLQEAELSQLSLNNIEINTEDDIARDDYSPTIIYNPEKPDASMLDRILKDKASHYKIVHVDSSIAKLQRTFSWDGSTIKDAFDDIANEVECLFKYGEFTENDGKIHRTISVYDLNDVCIDCGERGAFTNKVCTKCGSKNIKFGYGIDSGIFLNHENFAGDISYSSNSEDVKNCFRLVAGDDLMTATVRNISPSGSQYIWHLSDSLRNDMSKPLRDKLAAYDTEYKSYETDRQIDVPLSSVNDYNALVNKYKAYDKTLVNATHPIVGYAKLTDLYYNALNLYSILKTTLAPASEIGKKTTAKEEITKLTQTKLSPIGVQNADVASATTVTSAIQAYAKVFIDTALYRITANKTSYAGKVWKGTITLTAYADEKDTATTSELTINVSDATPDFIKCQLDKAMKKNEVDASGTVELFKKNDTDFKEALSYYSLDNLNILANIARGCLDILIQQGIATPSEDLYTSIYLPYYNKNTYIQDELREREAELLKLLGEKENPFGLLDFIELQRAYIADRLDLRKYLGEELWSEFCSFRRDDEYQNDNFISDGLSDSDLIKHAKEFVKSAERELVKSATLQHTISCNLNNLLLVREDELAESGTEAEVFDDMDVGEFLVRSNNVLSSIVDKFDVGNWLMLEIDDKIYRLRLTDYSIDYDSLDTLDVEFSDVTHGLGYMSDAKSILSKAASMSTSYAYVKHQASKGNDANTQLEDIRDKGFSLTNQKIVNSANSQDLVVDETGMIMRKKNDFGDGYAPEQIKIINHGFYYSTDNWKTVKTGLGKFAYFDPRTGRYEDGYGLIADKIVGNIILGEEVGIYNESGSLQVDKNGVTITANPDDPNKDLFTLQKKNRDGTYTKYIYVDDNGDIKINASNIEISSGSSIESFVSQTVKGEVDNLKIGSRNLVLDSKLDITFNSYGANVRYLSQDLEPDTYYTLSVNGRININADNPDNKVLDTTIFISDWSWQQYFRMNNTTDETKHLTFKTPKAKLKERPTIRFYYYPNTGTNTGTATVNWVKLEKGNKVTDWMPAPEDVEQTVNNSQNDASSALGLAESNQTQIKESMSEIKQLSDSISHLVTDEKGNSLMVQDSSGWHFNMGAIQKTLNDTATALSGVSKDLDAAETLLNTTKSMADALEKRTAFIDMTTVNGQPAIILGQSNSKFKLRITNTSIDFLDGSEAIAYISNQTLYITKAIIKDEIKIGEGTGWIVKRRPNGNLGFRWGT